MFPAPSLFSVNLHTVQTPSAQSGRQQGKLTVPGPLPVTSFCRSFSRLLRCLGRGCGKGAGVRYTPGRCGGFSRSEIRGSDCSAGPLCAGGQGRGRARKAQVPLLWPSLSIPRGRALLIPLGWWWVSGGCISGSVEGARAEAPLPGTSQAVPSGVIRPSTCFSACEIAPLGPQGVCSP